MNCVRNPRGMPSVVMLAVGSVEAPFSVEGIHAGKVVGSGGMEGGGAEVDASHSGRCSTRGVKGIAGFRLHPATAMARIDATEARIASREALTPICMLCSV